MNDARQLTTPEEQLVGDPPISLGEIARFTFRALKARFRDHSAELSIIRRHIKHGDVVCDIGANKGSFVYWLSRWAGRSGRVVAFEPQADLARRLEKICEITGLHNVTVEAKAVCSASGLHDLYIPVRHKPGASLNCPQLPDGEIVTAGVATVSLDDYFGDADPISVLKVDVEGAELGVFAGAARILRNHKPLLVFECEGRHLKGGSVKEVFGYLNSLGYDGYFVLAGRLLPMQLFDPAIHQRDEGDWFWKRKDYCNNFIFSTGRIR